MENAAADQNIIVLQETLVEQGKHVIESLENCGEVDGNFELFLIENLKIRLYSIECCMLAARFTFYTKINLFLAVINVAGGWCGGSAKVFLTTIKILESGEISEDISYR